MINCQPCSDQLFRGNYEPNTGETTVPSVHEREGASVWFFPPRSLGRTRSCFFVLGGRLRSERASEGEIEKQREREFAHGRLCVRVKETALKRLGLDLLHKKRVSLTATPSQVRNPVPGENSHLISLSALHPGGWNAQHTVTKLTYILYCTIGCITYLWENIRFLERV